MAFRIPWIIECDDPLCGATCSGDVVVEVTVNGGIQLADRADRCDAFDDGWTETGEVKSGMLRAKHWCPRHSFERNLPDTI